MTKKVKCKTSHGKNEESSEFGSLRSEFLCLKWGTPIILELRQHYIFYSCFDVLPSSLLDPSWVQVSQTTELFGTRGTLPALSIKKGRGAC